MPMAQTPFGGPGSGATYITGTSGTQANANAVATLTATPSQTVWLAGFQCNGNGSTSGNTVGVTVTGLLGGTLTYGYSFNAGPAPCNPLVVNFPYPIPASGPGVNIVVTIPAGGAGNTVTTCNAQGFLL